MDAQYPFASREDIWRVHEEVKDIYAIQAEHGDRLSKLERRKEDDARMKSLWGPFSPFPSTVSNPVHQDSSLNSPAEPFKGFDQGHQHALANHLNMEGEEDTRRGASRANSVRFDESSMQGYYSHANRSATEFAPARTGSGFGTHPLTERSLSHRSDGKQSSSGQSHHSARTNSLGLDSTRVGCSSTTTTPASQNAVMPPPPGLFILGPVPCIIRCWLTTKFSNDSLLYAAVCTGSFSSAVSSALLRKLNLEDEILVEDGVPTVKLPVYFPEASVCQSSSRGGTPEPHLPALTVRFLVRDTDHADQKAIAIFIGSDVLRVHNADILFSQDKMLMVDDERNRISIPLVRPEDHDSFRTLSTGPHGTPGDIPAPTERDSEDQAIKGHLEQAASATGHHGSPPPRMPMKSALTLRTSSDSLGGQDKSRSTRFADDPETSNLDQVPQSAVSEKSFGKFAKSEETSGVRGPWRRDTAPTSSNNASKNEPISYLAASQRSVRPRNMKVLRPTKPPSRPTSTATSSSSFDRPSSRSGEGIPRSVRSPSNGENGEPSQPAPDRSNNARSSSGDGSLASKSRPANPIGGASAFGWLNTRQGPTPE